MPMLILAAFLNGLVIWFILGFTDWGFLISSMLTLGVGGLAFSGAADGLARFGMGARPVTTEEEQQIIGVWQEVLRRAGKDQGHFVPQFFISDEPYPNAYALKNSVIITKGFLYTADWAEACGVLAHEVGHIHYGDSPTKTAAMAIGFMGSFIAKTAGAIVDFMARALATVTFGVSLIFMPLVWIGRAIVWIMGIGQTVGLMAVSRSAEFRADAYSAELGFGEGLVSYLRKIEPLEMGHNEGVMARLAKTHPPAAARIDAILYPDGNVPKAEGQGDYHIVIDSRTGELSLVDDHDYVFMSSAGYYEHVYAGDYDDCKSRKAQLEAEKTA